jgi:hypothetical protein
MPKKGSKLPVLPPADFEPVAFDIVNAAKFLCCTEWAVRRLIYQGKLSYKKAGKRIIIPRVVLEEFANTGLKREGTGRVA